MQSACPRGLTNSLQLRSMATDSGYNTCSTIVDHVMWSAYPRGLTKILQLRSMATNSGYDTCSAITIRSWGLSRLIWSSTSIMRPRCCAYSAFCFRSFLEFRQYGALVDLKAPGARGLSKGVAFDVCILPTNMAGFHLADGFRFDQSIIANEYGKHTAHSFSVSSFLVFGALIDLDPPPAKDLSRKIAFIQLEQSAEQYGKFTACSAFVPSWSCASTTRWSTWTHQQRAALSWELLCI